MKKLFYTFVGAMMLAGSASADIVTTPPAAVNSFGATGGVGVQFDASPVSATATGNVAVSGLTAGTVYNVDGISLVGNGATSTTPWYLGVYTAFDNATSPFAVSGFQGVSNQAIDWSTAGVGGAIAYTFSGITVTAGSDVADFSDRLFFLLQDSTTPLVNMPVIANNTTAIQRLVNAADVDSRVGIVQALTSAASTSFPGYRADRAPVISVTFSAVPEPSAIALLCLSSVFAVARRRKS